MDRTLRQIHDGAVRLAPRGSHMKGSGARADGINLQSSIFERSELRGDVYGGEVGSQKPYAMSEHQGSQPHVIRAKGKLLKFEWERGRLLMARRNRGRGRRSPQLMFYFRKVNHPGNKRPVRFLTTPMHMYGRANGFRTTSSPVTRGYLP